MLSAREKGELFEEKVNQSLKYYLRYYQNIYIEKEIRSKYGNHISGIDHFISIDKYIFCIQSKWKKKPEPNSSIHHFLFCLNFINEKHPEKITIGIYLSKLKVSKNANKSISINNIYTINIYNNDNINDNEHNEHNEHNEYNEDNQDDEDDYEEDNMNILIDKLLSYLHYIFGIYSYEYDESLIMRYSNFFY